VNFSDLMTWGSRLGWKNEPLVTQREFVNRWNFSKTKNPSSNRFSTPEDAGDSFLVLEQAKRLE